MKPEKPKVVLDTNIIVSAAISADGNPAKIFELLLENKIVNYTTLEILNEVEDVLDRPFFKKHIDENYRKFMVKNLQKNSFIIDPKFFENAVEKDSKDDKFLNCALSANADVISGDKHLLELKSYKNVKILAAKEFLDKFE